MSSSQNKCPYYNSKDCGRPFKDTYGCSEPGRYRSCRSYMFIEEANKVLKEEKKDGKQDNGENPEHG